MVSAPARIIRREPNRSRATPTGTCSAGVDGQLQHEEEGDRRRAGGEALLGVDGGDAQRRAVEDRDRVGGERHAPDDVGARRTGGRDRRSRAGPSGDRREASPQDDVGHAGTFRAGPVSSLTAARSARYSRAAMHNLVDPADDPAVDDGPRRGRILWALAACMAEKGYQATTIADIAARRPGSRRPWSTRTSATRSSACSSCTRGPTTRCWRRCRQAQEDARAAGLPWRDRLRAGIGAYLETLAAGPAVAWAALVEVQAAGRAGAGAAPGR